MKRTVQIAVAATGILLGGLYISNYANREQKFLDRAFIQLGGGGGSEYVADIDLNSGNSAAVILEHSCCSGAGFDAVAVRTSEGREFFAKKNYCGIEGFREKLKDAAITDLSHFTAFLRAQGYSERQGRSAAVAPNSDRY